MARSRTDRWYEEQAESAPWRGKVNGREAYVGKFKGKWEIACRVTRGGDGMVMFRLDNKAAIRNLADAVSPPLPEALLKKAMKAATRDVPVKKRLRLWPWLLLAALGAAVWIYFRRPGLVDAFLDLLRAAS